MQKLLYRDGISFSEQELFGSSLEAAANHPVGDVWRGASSATLSAAGVI